MAWQSSLFFFNDPATTEIYTLSLHDALPIYADPTYLVDGVVHYAVANMPGGVARTSTFALNNATLPFTIALAEQGPEAAMKRDPHLRAGLNVYKNTLTYEAVAEAQHLPWKSAESVLGIAA